MLYCANATTRPLLLWRLARHSSTSALSLPVVLNYSTDHSGPGGALTAGRLLDTSFDVRMAHETVDLTISDSDGEAESPRAAAAREAAQRQKIMEFARAKRARTGPAPGDRQEDAPGSAPSTEAGLKQLAQQQGPSEAPAQAPDSKKGSSGFDNSDLKALHEARMLRLRAQAGDGGAAVAAAAAGGGDMPGSSSRGDSSRGHGSQHQGSKTGATLAASNRGAAPSSASDATAGAKNVSLLTYNVWFREDVAVQERMQGIADIITTAGYPTFLCFQEMTPRIMAIFASMPWWQRYICSPAPLDAPYFTLLLVNRGAAPSAARSSFEEVHFDNSCMGRSLRVATITVGRHKVLVATSHLESPIPPHQWYSKERQQQMAFSLSQLNKSPYGNVLFAGDMNWTDSRDGSPPLPAGWSDAWQQLHPGDPGFTYDSKNNPMLPYKNQGLRLDRVFTRLADYRLSSISIVGREQLGGATYTHRFKNGGSKQLPVLPSDHFGLLVQIEEL